MKETTCCFFGHRKIDNTPELKAKLPEVIEKLISEENITTFLFGSKSEFDALCHEAVTEIKKKYPHIKRIYVRAEYPYIDDNYKNYLLKDYEDTYFPEQIMSAGKAVYVERNQYMIDNSSVCITYCDLNYTPSCRKNTGSVLTDRHTKSGTKIAYEYAVKKGARIINLK